jgi:hypothetical protein
MKMDLIPTITVALIALGVLGFTMDSRRRIAELQKRLELLELRQATSTELISELQSSIPRLLRDKKPAPLTCSSPGSSPNFSWNLMGSAPLNAQLTTEQAVGKLKSEISALAAARSKIQRTYPLSIADSQTIDEINWQLNALEDIARWLRNVIPDQPLGDALLKDVFRPGQKLASQ